MTPPNRLVQAAAEASCDHEINGGPRPVPCTRCWFRAQKAIAAAFAALPVDEIRKETWEAVAQACEWKGQTITHASFFADAASDVWLAALARFGEPT